MRTGLRTVLFALLTAGVLALAFSAYLRPGFVVDLATRWWMCL